MYTIKLFLALSLGFVIACKTENVLPSKTYPVVGTIERVSPLLNDIIDSTATIEILASGFGWAEGPIWMANEKKLLFTDVRDQMIYQWTEKDSIQVYLSLADSIKTKPGPSALLVDKDNKLVILRYGHGEAVRMNSSMEHPSNDFTVFTNNYNGKRFNNTNDASFFKNGDMYMSDPPHPKDSVNGLSAGLYRIDAQGKATLLTDTLSSPNGVAFSPDYHTIYVSNADSKNAFWMVADVDENGNLSNGRKFFDATGNAPPEKGHPDGLRVNKNGIIFATGPGGIYILSPAGQHLGTIKNNEFNTNCALDDTEKTLYITAGSYLMRVVMKK